ncbi:MAG TPA: hypothetical protein VGJ73_15575 [Verrucomicrobiae bacterium]|jgi:hypothetical protein
MKKTAKKTPANADATAYPERLSSWTADNSQPAPTAKADSKIQNFTNVDMTQKPNLCSRAAMRFLKR